MVDNQFEVMPFGIFFSRFSATLIADYMICGQVALDSALRAIRVHTNQTAALVNAGIAYQRLDRFGSSVNMFQRALYVDPSNPKANGYLGAALYDWASSLAAEGTPVINQEVSSFSVVYS
jgi:regulator of sirC expression with transglutaminase-like and TPR domain